MMTYYPIREENGALIISHRTLSDEDVTNSVKRVNETITTLKIHCVEIAPERLKTLCRGIAKNPRFTTLKLSDYFIDDEGATTIATSLPNLTTLELNYTRIGLKGAIALSELPNLESLNLSYNDVGDEGMRALSSATKLTRLSLRDNSIGFNTDDAIASLSKLPKLESLDLSNNGIGNKGAKTIATTMMKLKELHLMRCGIDDDGAIALSKLRNLITLSVACNSIGNDGAIALFNLPKITTLDLRWSYRIENQDALLSAFESHPTLFDLDVRFVDSARIEAIQNRKRMRAFCESTNLNDNVTSKIFKYL